MPKMRGAMPACRSAFDADAARRRRRRLFATRCRAYAAFAAVYSPD